MKNLLLSLFVNAEGQPTALVWAVLVIIAVVVFATIMILIFKLYGREGKGKTVATEIEATTAVEVPPVEPVEFEKRNDEAATVSYTTYDPDAAQKEQERIEALLLEEENKRKELEAKEQELELKRQKQEEERLERERLEAERRAEKERAKAEKAAAKAAKKNAQNSADNFFADDEDEQDAFTFGDENDQSENVDFWNQTTTEPNLVVTPEPEVPATDPRLEKVLAELENQKQAEQEKFASLMAELENQKQETSRLKDELASKEQSEAAMEQAKKDMEQMIKESQEKMAKLEADKSINKGADKDLLKEIKEILATERESQEQRLREQENSLAAVLSAMENERRAKEENQLNAQQEAKKEDEFVKLQNQYQEAIAQMQEKFAQMLNEANAQKQMVDNTNYDAQNAYQAQLERERAETTALIQQMQREVDKMNAEREAERQEYAAKQRELNATMEEALRTQRTEFEMAQKQVDPFNVEKILQDIENQRAHEQEMFNNILAELAAGREDTNQAKAAIEKMIHESEARIDRLEKQQMSRGLDDEAFAALKDVLAAEREEQEQRFAAYQAELEDIKNNLANRKPGDDDEGNEVAYSAKAQTDPVVLERMAAMQAEIEKMAAEKAAEREAYEQRYAELVDALNQTIATGENAKRAETQSIERESVDKILQDIEDQKQAEQDKFTDIMNELAESRADTQKAQAAMEQLIRENSDLINQLHAQKEVRGVDEETLAALKDILALEREEQEKRFAEYQAELADLKDTIMADKEAEAKARESKFTAQETELNPEFVARIEAMQDEIKKISADKEAEKEAYEQRYAELLDALNQTIITGENAQSEATQQAERDSVNKILQDIEDQKQAEQDKYADIMNELAVSREDTQKAQAAMEQLIRESTDLINQLHEKQEVRGVDEETLAALKDLLAAEREAQEKRLSENEANLKMAIEAIEEQKSYMADEQRKQAEYEQTIANMREQYEAELAALKDNLSMKIQEADALQAELDNQAGQAQNNGATIVNDDEMITDENADVDAATMTTTEEDEVKNAEIVQQLTRMQEEIEALEQAREAERADFERKYEELNKVLEESLKVQRLEMELAKEKEINALKMQQALDAQRAEFEASKEQEKAEDIASSTVALSEQTNAILANFKEEMNRQYEDFLTLLNNKKAEAENARQGVAGDEDNEARPEFDMQEVMEQLLEERKAARLETQALREELEAQRIESEAKLMKQLSEVKEGLVAELSSELEIKEKFNSLEQEVENQSQEKLKQSEAEEARIKQEYEEYKKRIADEVVALEEKNAALQAELEKARSENALEDDKKAEYEENEKRLREKYMQLRNELMKEAQQVSRQSEEIEAEKLVIEEKKKDLEEEKARLQNEVEMLKQQVLEITAQDGQAGATVSAEKMEEIRAQLEEEYKHREKEMLDKLEQEKQALVAREAQLKLKETNIEREEERIKEQSMAVTTMITNREYTKEERERLIIDYNLKLQDLEERLRQNEKALRENNREFIPLRRIKNTLDRDMRLLRKREAIVAKQEVLVYGVNNISTVDPEKIKKLEQDIKQLTGLQQSVANCETILNKNKDRYPTLENLDKVLRAQNEQIRNDLEEVKAAMAMFSDDGEKK